MEGILHRRLGKPPSPLFELTWFDKLMTVTHDSCLNFADRHGKARYHVACSSLSSEDLSGVGSPSHALYVNRTFFWLFISGKIGSKRNVPPLVKELAGLDIADGCP